MDVTKEWQTTWLNLEIFSNPSEMQRIASQMEQYLEKIQDSNYIFINSYQIRGNAFPLQMAVIDFECNPPKLCGILLLNRIYQIYIKSEQLTHKFNGILVKLLSILSKLYLFCFSNHEIRFIKKILPHTVKKMQPKVSAEFLNNLKMINIQLRTDEGLVPALYSIGEEPYNDPLLRDNKIVDFHFQEGHYNLLLEHNKSCLLSTLKLVKTRYLKLNLW